MKNFGNITAHGQVYLYPDKPAADLVWIDPKGHENFWCSVTGGTSGSSSSPRTEGRETLVDSAESYNWQVDGRVHSMVGEVRVELAPSSGKVIVGQIHAYKGPNPFAMVTWWNGVARVDVRTNPTGAASKVLSIPCELGQTFEYGLLVGADGMLAVGLDGHTTSLRVDPAWSEFPFYFKAGAYVIDNDGPEAEGGWVVYETNQVLHK
jgi:hypothetical protein